MSKYVFIDFETDNEKGYGLQVWSKRFKVSSCAFLTETTQGFLTDSEDIHAMLHYHLELGFTFVVYNASFDCNIMAHVFGITNAFSKSIDTWRLASYCNQTVDDDASVKKDRDTSLVGSVKYFFGEEDFKEKHLQYLIDTGKAKNIKEAHKNVAMLPHDRLEAYNLEDVIQTKRVFEHCVALLTQWGMPWQRDHLLYMHEASLYAKSFIDGIRVDREMAFGNMAALKTEIDKLHEELMRLPEVLEAERRLIVYPSKVTHPGRKKHRNLFPDKWFMGEPSDEEIKQDLSVKTPFNFNSGKHKQLLFIDILGFPVVRYTSGGKRGNPQPEISKATLPEYGDIGKLLLRMLKRQKELKQLETIEAMSREDGRLHPMLRSSTTVSGRSSSTMES